MKSRRAVLAAGTVGLLATTGLVAAHAAGSDGAACTVTYTVAGQWPGGFLSSVQITNHGAPLTKWTLGFDFPDTGQRIGNGWSAEWSQSGQHVTADSMSWNAAVGSDQSVGIGFVGFYSSGNGVPARFTINGATCTGKPGSTPTPTPTSTAPAPTPTPTSTAPTPTSTAPTPTPTPTSTAPTPTTTTTTTTSLSSSPPTTSTTPPGTPSGSAPALHVSGNKLLTSSGATYRMLGVNRSSGEFACVQGKGMWDGNPSDQAGIDAMKAWNIHTVRIPLNEECWLGVSGSPSGAAYQQNVKDYVDVLLANGITPVVEMHWNHGQYNGNGAGCSDTAATCQKPMPDAEYAPKFWTSVANMFKGNNAVVLDLFNEPYPDAAANWDAAKAWTCWRDGGTCTGIGYQVAGMQSLVDAVRATGATNVIMIGGLAWSNDVSQWLAHKPSDPTGNLMASWHTYNFNSCSNTSCWDSQVAAVAAKVPVTAGEIGQNSCAHDYIDKVMNWADANGVGYLGWTWNAWGCSNGNVLITNFDGTPTSTFGEGFKAHLLTQDPLS